MYYLIINRLKYLWSWFKVFMPLEIVNKVFDLFHIYYRDLRFLLNAVKIIRQANKCIKDNTTIVKAFESTLKRFPNKNCFLYENISWTFGNVEDYSNRVCSLFGEFIEKREVVALMLPNCPEYACIWLGCAKAGIITSLINTNLRKRPLQHCINLSKPKAIIYSNLYETVISDILNDIEGNPKFYSFEGESIIPNSEMFGEALESTNPTKNDKREIDFKDKILYIFTSGTTGLPKPANITHSKLIGASLIGKMIVGVRKDDIIYSPMPMYHSACTGSAVAAFTLGATVIFRRKFSASAFISDCRKYNATAAQYIGEMLRYVVNTPVQEDERNHRIRLISGNGVTADIWEKFVKRFNIPAVYEYYGSSEGNFMLVNTQNVIGSCGYLPTGIPFYYLLGPSIIRVNETGQPLRNKNGFCSLARPGETGLCIGYCPPGNEMRKFHGYVTNSESDINSKVIRNVFKTGDSAYNTGDLMSMNNRGWLTFVDRIGDTYRWKGENVSTIEVETILKSFPMVEDCAVYGVQVSDLEGKAGMAAIVLNRVDIEELNRYLEMSLPSYAQPLFIRLVDSFQYTSTFKVVKVHLKKQAYDIGSIPDPLLIKYNGKYVPLSKEVYQLIQEGRLKF